jgi:hypothetical protein
MHRRAFFGDPAPILSLESLLQCCWCAENGFMGMGIGAAMTGLRPIVEGMNMGFLLLAFNQVGPGKTAAAVYSMPHNCLSYVSLGHSRLWASSGQCCGFRAGFCAWCGNHQQGQGSLQSQRVALACASLHSLRVPYKIDCHDEIARLKTGCQLASTCCMHLVYGCLICAPNARTLCSSGGPCVTPA